MVRSENVIVAFVASPSDVEDERNQLEELVKELNLTWSKTLGARLELIRWETHTYPGIGQDAQDVVNEQLGDEYDIFIGIMWGRFGHPTHRAESGTEEEFLKAWQKHEENSNIKIMFYFKDEPISPSKLDPEQLAKIQAFKSKIGEEGVYYWSFKAIDDFKNLLRLHLARQIQSFQNFDNVDYVPSLKTNNATDLLTENEEEGLIDLIEKFEERMRIATEIANRIAQANSDIAKKINLRSEEINQATSPADGNISRSEAKRIINKAADDMDQYVTRIVVEIPIFKDAFADGIKALGEAATITVDFAEDARSDVKETREAVTDLLKALTESHASMSSLRQTIHTLPRMTSQLNKSKKKTLEAVDGLLLAFEANMRNATEASKLLDSIIADKD